MGKILDSTLRGCLSIPGKKAKYFTYYHIISWQYWFKTNINCVLRAVQMVECACTPRLYHIYLPRYPSLTITLSWFSVSSNHSLPAFLEQCKRKLWTIQFAYFTRFSLCFGPPSWSPAGGSGPLYWPTGEATCTSVARRDNSLWAKACHVAQPNLSCAFFTSWRNLQLDK